MWIVLRLRLMIFQSLFNIKIIFMLQMSSDNLDPLGYIPLHIPTDPLYPELDDMDTFKTFALTMEENSVKPTQRCPNTPLSACSIPDTPEGRRALVDKIFLLFEEELKDWILAMNKYRL